MSAARRADKAIGSAGAVVPFPLRPGRVDAYAAVPESVATRPPLTIGVLAPLVGGFYFGGVLQGIATAARGAGARVLAVQTFESGVEHADPLSAWDVSQPLGHDHMDGFIAVLNAVGESYLRELAESGRPVVWISAQTEVPGCIPVMPDNRGGIFAAVEHLVAHGHTRIAYAGCLAQRDVRERYAAYQEAMAAHGLAATRDLFFEVDDNVHTGGAQAARRMVAAGMPSTAVLAGTDSNAVGLLAALADAGLSLPDDQAVVGFDDIELAQFTAPRLATVRQSFREVGTTATQLVLRKLRGESLDERTHLVPTTFVARESCGCHEGVSQREEIAQNLLPRDRIRATLSAVLARPRAHHDSAVLPTAAPSASADTVADRVAEVLASGCNYTAADVREAVVDLYRARPGFDTAQALTEAMLRYGVHVLPSDAATGTEGADDVATHATRALAHAQLAERYEEATYFRSALSTQYTVGMALLGVRDGNPYDLSWLAKTPAVAGVLGLWESKPSSVRLVGAFDGTTGGSSDLSGDGVLPVEQFPPSELFDRVDAERNEIVFALPLRVADSDWGWLSLVSPIDTRVLTGRETISEWAALLTVALDVNAREKHIETLGRELNVVLESSPDAIIRYDTELTYRYLNRAAAAALGRSPAEVIGRRDAELGRDPVLTERWLDALQRVATSGAALSLDFSETRAEGTRWYQASIVPLTNSDGAIDGVLAVSRDITALKHAEQALAHQAVHDSLTGLANRTLFLDRLTQAVTRLEREPGRLAVLFIDLDHFKDINDSLGHEVGDRLLVQASHRLQQLCRRTDTLGRFGGDEFVLLCDRLTAAEDIRIIAERLVRGLAEPFFEGGRELNVSASIGIALNSTPNADPSVLLRNADEAMYLAKARGRNQFCLFDERLHAIAANRPSLEGDLRHAVEREQLRLAYQPLFGLRSGVIHGVEALVRWQHPRRGVIPPNEFIGLAERRGLIVSIGAWVIDEALRQLAEWATDPCLAKLGMSVNVSPRQLTDSAVIGVISEALAKHSVDPGRLTLEITETALLENDDRMRETLSAIAKLGVRIALDDFGTGFSSLIHLRDFPVDTVKIDRSFVDQVTSATRAKEIVGALIVMAHYLDMTIVGEGIEEQAQWDALLNLGCDSGQGYLVSEPMAPAGIPALIHRSRPGAADHNAWWSK